MDPVTASVVVAKPAAEVFGYLADVANHPEFQDHYTSDWHLTREDSYGKGAGARYAVDQRFNRYGYVDQTIVEFEPARRIVLAGRSGKFNRVRSLTVYELEPAGGGGTRVTASYETMPKYPSDKLMEGKGFHKRGIRKAVKRLRDILEDDHGRGKRITIAGGARKPATGFRMVRPDEAATK